MVMPTFAPSPQSAGNFIDSSRASAISCLYVDEHSVLATVALSHLLELVPDPESLEDKKLVPSLVMDPTLARYIDERSQVQRMFTGEKKKNKPRYADFITERTMHREHRGTPPILLGTTAQLKVVQYQEGFAKIGVPFGRKLLAVDGETQRAAWQEAYRRFAGAVDDGAMEQEALDEIRVPVEIHHGLSTSALGDLFYWRNVLGTRVNANEALSRDMHDPATQIVRRALELPVTKVDGQQVKIARLVQMNSRQVGKAASEWLTLSALRTLVVTMIYGRGGFQYGAKPVPPLEGVDFTAVREEVATTVAAFLQRFAVQFTEKDRYLIGAPAILGGIGVFAQRSLTTLPHARPSITREQLIEHLDSIRWEREGFWEGIGTRRTPKGAITVAGPKEVGYAVSDAIDGTNPDTAARIRGKAAGQVTPPYQPSITAPWPDSDPNFSLTD